MIIILWKIFAANGLTNVWTPNAEHLFFFSVENNKTIAHIKLRRPNKIEKKFRVPCWKRFSIYYLVCLPFGRLFDIIISFAIQLEAVIVR